MPRSAALLVVLKVGCITSGLASIAATGAATEALDDGNISNDFGPLLVRTSPPGTLTDGRISCRFASPAGFGPAIGRYPGGSISKGFTARPVSCCTR